MFVKELLMSNGYPANFIDSIHRFLSKQNTDVIQPYGPQREEYSSRALWCYCKYFLVLAKYKGILNKFKTELELAPKYFSLDYITLQ